MVHFVVFSDNRLEGVQHYMDRYNLTDNTIEFVIREDLTTRELGGLAFAHHVIYPEDTLVVVPGVLDMFTWDDEVRCYLPLYASVEAAVTAYGVCFDDILINLLAAPLPYNIIVTDLVGMDTITWDETPGDSTVQDWVDAVVPRVRDEADRVNAWVGMTNVPLGSRVHVTRRTVDGILHVHDYRSFPDGFLPGRRQLRRWARVFANLLAEYVDGHYHN